MKWSIYAALCIIPLVQGHLRLTFPQARMYALDFLDNVRTAAPCGGMTYDGTTMTTLKTDVPITFTWQSVYPHLGGIRFELLDVTTNAITANLTGEGYLYTDDSTIREHTLTLAEEHACEHCVLRLIRQAGEWVANAPGGYLFWSCADVSVVSSDDTCYAGKCLNGGTCSDGSCNCERTYEGDRCQYKNDCEDDNDCNNNGVCRDIQSTYYPTRVCFCNSGKMGRQCSKDSPVSNAVKSSEDLREYYHSELYGDPAFQLYWKLIGAAQDEIEMVLQVETNNWIGIGWRPDTVTGECRNFPTNTAIGTNPEPEGTAEGSPAPEGTAEGTPEPEGTAEGTAAPESAPENRSRKRREAAGFEVMGKVVRRLRRETEVNVLKDLCLAGNVTAAVDWANRNYFSDAGEPAPIPEGEAPAPEGEAPAPEGETPAPEGETPAPEGETPAPEGETPAPEGETPAPEGETPAPEGESPAPEGEGTPEHSYPEGEGTPSPEGEGTPSPEGEGEPEPEGTSTRFHPMDCQDMVIVAAEGDHHRILDSYTRDRSTPQPDSFFGGTDDLTAAAAARVDGVLHAVFRRKIASSDQADHSLTDTANTVVWARGQNPVRMYHWPLTGIERCRASNYDFYKLNELKYHGTKDSQRGSRTLNFFENPDGGDDTTPTGQHSSPPSCSGDQCDYVASWTYVKEDQKVQFTITAKIANGQWAAIGFSDDQDMEETDAILLWMNDAGTNAIATDRYITSKSIAGVSSAGDDQDVQVTGGSYNNGMMTVSFERAVDTGDSKDLALNECRFFLYAWGGGVNGQTAAYHSNRESSTTKICIASGSPRVVISNLLTWASLLCAIVVSRFTLQ